ncbi:UNVERIFIED_CONTAM: hypothetical protein RMT77_011970 [Armadillidium vulgare]
MNTEIQKWCDELDLKGKEATNFIELHKFFDINVDEQIQFFKELEIEHDDAIELLLEIAEIRRRGCKLYYNKLREVSDREAATEKIEMKYKLLKNDFLSRIDETPNPIIEVISTKKSRTLESVSLENNIITTEKQITSGQEFQMKGENSHSEIFVEREEPLFQDLPILPTLPEWERNKDEVFSSSKGFVEQDEREESSVSSNVLSWTDNTLSSKRLSNQSITISSETESKIGQPRMGMSEFKSESEIKCNIYDRKSTAEEEKEGYEHNLTVTTSIDYSLLKEKVIKKPYLECEKDSQLHPFQDKRNFEDFHKRPMVNQDDNSSNERGMWDGKKFDVNVSPKFGDKHISFFTKEIAKIQIEEDKHKISQSRSMTPSNGINDCKISRELRPEERE